MSDEERDVNLRKTEPIAEEPPFEFEVEIEDDLPERLEKWLSWIDR